MGQNGIQKIVSASTGVTFYLYMPNNRNTRPPLFITVHGWSRNAEEHAELFLPYAERYGAVLVAPLFDVKRFPRYGRLGHGTADNRADHVLDHLIEEAQNLSGAETASFYLFGYSGGGQFAHRYMMAHPGRVARLALGAPGWYTFPDPSQRFPRGIGPSKSIPDIELDPSRFLQIPAKVLVGEHDTRRDRHLNTSLHIDRMQGTTRRERAERWVQAMNAAARACGYATRYSFELLPHSNHSFRRCMKKGGMGDAVFAFLFENAAKPSVG